MEKHHHILLRLKKYKAWLLLLAAIILLEWLKQKPEFVEAFYSTGIYPLIGNTLRILLGWLPISIGDSMVFALIFILLVKLVLKFGGVIKREASEKQTWQSAIAKWVFRLALVYISFFGLWGLNYYRLGSSYQLQLQPAEYTNADLDTLLTVLQSRLYKICKDSALIEQQKTQDRRLLSADAQQAYQLATLQYPFLSFKHKSLKPMLIGALQSYVGYTGYVFPFTGEAQVNFYVPAIDLPFTVCHEMAHQVGYGHESEANMVGFLACRTSSNVFFTYSAYSNMQGYAQNEMYNRDTLLYKVFRNNVPPILLKDRIENEKFSLRHKNFFQPLINWVYGQYLESNNQPLGLKSYNYVVAWLVAYGKKYGWDKI